MKDALLHGTEPPSEWVKRWSHLVKSQGTVLDVACGYGRHASYFYQNNHAVALVDRAQAAIDSIAMMCPNLCAGVEMNRTLVKATGVPDSPLAIVEWGF